MEKIRDTKYLAVDFGASSGRAVVGTLTEEKKLSLEILYRFPNGGVAVGNSLYWNILLFFQEIKNALKLFVDKYRSGLVSMGLDTWGVDFVLLDNKDELIGFPHHYRDKRTDGIMEEMWKNISKEEIFKQTGIQFLELNSSVQLYSMLLNKSPKLSIAKTFLMLPDYLNFLLSGVKGSEFSISTTSQLYNPIKKDWARDLIKKLGLNPALFCKIYLGGKVLGNLRPEIAEETGVNKDVKIIAPLCHDTASAVAAVPVDLKEYEEGKWAYLSSGTWSLIGVELKNALITSKALKYNFTNEGGLNGTIRFLKNISGMWLIQECKNIWDKQGLCPTWNDIENFAREEKEFQFFIDPDDHLFMHRTNMIEAVKYYCKTHQGSNPETVGQISRTIFESLAFKYKQTIENLEDIIQKKIQILYIIGGGSSNNLLNQFTANVLNIPVKAGPTEATAIGNILVQALALGRVKDAFELRQIVRNSFPSSDFIPQETEKWKNAYITYRKIVK